MNFKCTPVCCSPVNHWTINILKESVQSQEKYYPLSSALHPLLTTNETMSRNQILSIIFLLVSYQRGVACVGLHAAVCYEMPPCECIPSITLSPCDKAWPRHSTAEGKAARRLELWCWSIDLARAASFCVPTTCIAWIQFLFWSCNFSFVLICISFFNESKIMWKLYKEEE